MTIEINDKLEALVYSRFASKADFMAGVFKEDSGYTMRGRVRFYRENTGDPFKDKDRKSWFGSKTPYPTIKECLKSINEGIAKLSLFSLAFGYGVDDPEITTLLREGRTNEEFTKLLSEQPWAHTKVMEKEDVPVPQQDV